MSLIEDSMCETPHRGLDIRVARALGWTDTLVSNFPAQLAPPDAPETATTVPYYSNPRSDRDKAALLDALLWLTTKTTGDEQVELHHHDWCNEWYVGIADGCTIGALAPGHDLAAFALAVCRAVLAAVAAGQAGTEYAADT